MIAQSCIISREGPRALIQINLLLPPRDYGKLIIVGKATAFACTPEHGMCLAIPMEVVTIDGYMARCRAKGVERPVSLFLLQDEPVATGDFVMVHVGYAIQKVTPQEARSAWELYDEVLAAGSGDPHA
jgi:hydrogenase expression/formation protein HypC